MRLFKAKKKNIKLVTIEGEIKASTEGKFGESRQSQIDLLEKLYDIAEDDKIHGCILRLDSPGGAAGTSEEIYQAVKYIAENKPVIASIGNLGCSGAYLIACAANKIIATKMAFVGSIGVIMMLPNLSKAKDKVGVDMVVIKSGKMKDVGNMFRDMQDEERKLLEDLAHECHEDFIHIVEEGRKNLKEGYKELLDGRILSTSTALDYGFIDEIGTYQDAIEAMADELDVDVEKLNIIKDKKKTGLIGKLLSLSCDNIATLLSEKIVNTATSTKYFK